MNPAPDSPRCPLCHQDRTRPGRRLCTDCLIRKMAPKPTKMPAPASRLRFLACEGGTRVYVPMPMCAGAWDDAVRAWES